jgi:hypothetical protein
MHVEEYKELLKKVIGMVCFGATFTTWQQIIKGLQIVQRIFFEKPKIASF